MSKGPISTAQKGMGRKRTYIREGRDELEYIEACLKDRKWTGEELEKKRRRRQHLMTMMRQMEADIEEGERVAYGNCAPKSPPDLERMDKIRKATGS